MKIEIWSDIACPFCYIGKRRLEKALVEIQSLKPIHIEWKSFLLNPDLQTDPHLNMIQSLSKHKGWSLEQTHQITKQVTDMAAGDGLLFDFDHAKVANTLKAHRLLHLAKSLNQGDTMKEALLESYFINGVNVDDNEALLDIALKIGLEKDVVLACLTSDQFQENVYQDIEESQSIGVRGVPFFVIDRKYGISGAQAVEVFVETLQKALAESADQLQSVAPDTESACDIEGGKC
jgi:predicted DsbA family dithiol-disulfide isomerase